jgi:hypothetical protein
MYRSPEYPEYNRAVKILYSVEGDAFFGLDRRRTDQRLGLVMDAIKASDQQQMEHGMGALEDRNVLAVFMGGNFEMSPLGLAIRTKQPNLVMALLKMEGVDVNAVAFRADTESGSKEFRSPLILAIQENQASIVSELLAHGADLNQAMRCVLFEDPEPKNFLPKRMAMLLKRTAILQILKQFEAKSEMLVNVRSATLMWLMCCQREELKLKVGKNVGRMIAELVYASRYDPSIWSSAAMMQRRFAEANRRAQEESDSSEEEKKKCVIS